MVFERNSPLHLQIYLCLSLEKPQHCSHMSEHNKLHGVTFWYKSHHALCMTMLVPRTSRLGNLKCLTNPQSQPLDPLASEHCFSSMNCNMIQKIGFIPFILWNQVPYGNFKSIMGFLFFRGTRSRLTPLFKFYFQAYWWLKVIYVTKMHYSAVVWFAIDDFVKIHFPKFVKPFMLLNENHSINAI